MCLLLPLLSIRNAIVRENKLGWNGIGLEGSRLCHQFDGTSPCGICGITDIGGWAVCFRGACIYCAIVHQAFGRPRNAHLRPSLTCTYFWADDRRWASLSARSFVCTGFAPRNFKKGSADRPLFCLLVFARGFHMIFQHMCWSSHVCTSHVETMLDGEERMHT